MESAAKVQVMESSLVAPREAAPTKALWLSPIDVVATAGHTPLLFLYSSCAAFSNVARLKEAMARALVAFYPLAGRLAADENGRLEISCNGEGVLFVVSRSYLAAEDIDFKPSPQLRKMFVPRIEPLSLVMAIQVTFFKCGRVVLGVGVHHAAVDATSFLHFLQTWSAFARDGDGAAIELPCHDRTLLRARSPPVVHPDALSVLYPKVALSEPSGPIAVEMFPISREQVVTLRRLCGGASTFCSVSALVWQCASVARRLPPDATARLTFPVNTRRRRGVRPPVPARYFGNALVELAASGAAREIASEALASVASRISRAIARLDDDGGSELVRSTIDYLELFETGTRPASGSMLETEIRAVSWLNMPVHEADFGCGGPRWMLRAESLRGGYVFIMNDGPRECGAVRVLVGMEAANIKEFGVLLYATIANHASSKL